MSAPIIIKGNSKLLKPVITQIMALHQMIEGIEVGGSSNDETMYPGRRFNPQIRLFFLQDTDYSQTGANTAAYQGRRRLSGRLTFRLMNETSETISKGELTRIGTGIKNIFGANGGYIWDKGKELYTYADWSKGYQMQMLVRSSTQARDLTTKILSLQNHSPQWVYLTKSSNEAELERYPETPQTKIILGEVVTLKKVRPRVEVRFHYADVDIHRLMEPVILYDRTSKKVGALVSA